MSIQKIVDAVKSFNCCTPYELAMLDMLVAIDKLHRGHGKRHHPLFLSQMKYLQFEEDLGIYRILSADTRVHYQLLRPIPGRITVELHHDKSKSIPRLVPRITVQEDQSHWEIDPMTGSRLKPHDY